MFLIYFIDKNIVFLLTKILTTKKIIGYFNTKNKIKFMKNNLNCKANNLFSNDKINE
jgi:hypothetical protein